MTNSDHERSCRGPARRPCASSVRFVQRNTRGDISHCLTVHQLRRLCFCARPKIPHRNPQFPDSGRRFGVLAGAAQQHQATRQRANEYHPRETHLIIVSKAVSCKVWLRKISIKWLNALTRPAQTHDAVSLSVDEAGPSCKASSACLRAWK